MSSISLFSNPESKYIFDNISPEIIKNTKELLSKYDVLTTARLLGYNIESYDNLLLSGRLLIYDLRRNCSPNISDYADELKDRFNPICYNFIKENSQILQNEINKNIESDYDNDMFSSNTLIRTYLSKMSYDDSPCETPQYMYMRIAVQLYHDEGIEKVLKCYRELSQKYLTHASPTIFNSCFKKNALSSCFLMSIEDNLEDILETGIKVPGLISANCGATGIDVSKIRHSEINGQGDSSGLVKFLQVVNYNCRYVDQGGRRRGNTAIFIRPHHLDIFEVVSLLNKVGDKYEIAEDINISIYANNLFFERVKQKAKWTLFCPAKTPWLNNIYGDEFSKKYAETEKLAEERQKKYLELKAKYEAILSSDNVKFIREAKYLVVDAKRNIINHKVVNAYDLFEHICKMQMKSGGPFICNGDAINIKCNQKNLGYIPSSNLCQEITLYSDKNNIASCNLASLSLRMFVLSPINRSITNIYESLRNSYCFQKLGEITMSAVYNIDKVITHNYYSLDTKDSEGNIIPGKLRICNEANRPLGIGEQGFGECLFELDLCIDVDVEYVRTLNIMISACMYFNGIAQSIILSMENQPYKNFEGSPLSQGKFQFDLWKEEFEIRGPNSIRPSEPEPMNPLNWGQKQIILSNGDVIEPSWQSLRECVMAYGVRNSMLFANMPTSTSSQILRNTETMEMPQSNLYSRVVLNGSYPVLNRYLVKDFKEINCWNNNTLSYLQTNNGSVKNFDSYLQNNQELFLEFNFQNNKNLQRLKFLINKYKTMWEISQKYLLTLTADRGRYICHSESKNIYLSNPTLDQIKACHLTANDLGLKNIMYYLRQSPAMETIKFTVDPKIQKHIKNDLNLKVDLNVSVNVNASETDVVCDPNNKDCLACQ